MFKLSIIYRVLFEFYEEPDRFLVAQDAAIVMHSFVDNLTQLDDLVAHFRVLEREAPADVRYQDVFRELTYLRDRRTEMIDALTPLASLADTFWVCAPGDMTKYSPETSQLYWRMCKTNPNNLPEGHIKGIDRFKQMCLEVIHEHFEYYHSQSIAEKEMIAREDVMLAAHMCSNDGVRLMNAVPLEGVEMIRKANGVLFGASRFPRTYVMYSNRNFSDFLGWSLARLLGMPMTTLSVNNMELDHVRKNMNQSIMSEPVTLFYRAAGRGTVVAKWEISGDLFDATSFAFGTDITNDMESSKVKQVGDMQKMLRQWLHSIRNASFEQQALVLLEEIRNLQSSMETDKHNAQFNSITDGLKMLIHTAKISIGLIDQALESKGGLVQQMSVADFANSLMKFPHNFAESEGIGFMPLRFVILLDNNPATLPQLDAFVVKCDVIAIQAFVDNVLSNAVRYTDASKGVEITLHITRVKTDAHSPTAIAAAASSAASMVQPSSSSADGIGGVDALKFYISVRDFCPGGLPDKALDYLRAGLGPHKCLDDRNACTKGSDSGKSDVSASRSTLLSKEKSDRSLSDSDENSMRTPDISSVGVLPTVAESGYLAPAPLSPPSSVSAAPSSTRTSTSAATNGYSTASDSSETGRSSATSAGTRRSAAKKSVLSLSSLQFSPSRHSYDRSPLYGANRMGMSSNASTSSFGSRLDASPDRPDRDLPHKPGKSRSSGTGLPHLFELYEQLLAQRGDEFDFSLRTSQLGTNFKIKFRATLMSGSAPEPGIVHADSGHLGGVPSPISTPPKHGAANGTSTPTMSDVSVPELVRTQRSDSSSGKSIIGLPNGILLVVDDSAVIRKLLSKYLNDLKCPHQLCCDGEEALAWFREHHMECAAIITDQEMPRMGGEALITNARHISLTVPCYIVSGNELSATNLPPGVRRTILKPVSVSMMRSIVDEIVEIQNASKT